MTRPFFSYRSKHRVSESVPSTRASLTINHTGSLSLHSLALSLSSHSLALSLSPHSLALSPHSLAPSYRLSACFVGRADESSKRKGFSLCNVTDTPCIRPENRKPIPSNSMERGCREIEQAWCIILSQAKKPSKAKIDSMLFRPASSRYVHSTHTSDARVSDELKALASCLRWNKLITRVDKKGRLTRFRILSKRIFLYE